MLAVLKAIPDGAAGTRATLNEMTALVRHFKKYPVIKLFTAQLVQQLPGKEWLGEIEVCRQFVMRNIRYLNDVTDVETVMDPIAVLTYRHGDCDDQATLICAMLESIGHPTRFTAVGFEPDMYSHVFAEAKCGRYWIACETTENVPLGWRPPGVVCRMRSHN